MKKMMKTLFAGLMALTLCMGSTTAANATVITYTPAANVPNVAIRLLCRILLLQKHINIAF